MPAELPISAWSNPRVDAAYGGVWRGWMGIEPSAAGLVSTVDDLLAFSRMFVRGGSPVLSAESVRMMTSDQLTPEQKARGGLSPDEWEEYSWGFGGAVLPSGAYTCDGGLGTSWLVDPNRDFTVMVLTQRLFGDAGIPPVHLDLRRLSSTCVRKDPEGQQRPLVTA
jgi:CubicO group peptidase (beta-lactamase class C family)